MRWFSLCFVDGYPNRLLGRLGYGLLVGGLLGSIFLALHEGLLGPVVVLAVSVAFFIVSVLSPVSRGVLVVTTYYVASETLKRISFVTNHDLPLVQYIPLLFYQASVVAICWKALYYRLTEGRIDSFDKYYAAYVVAFIVSTLMSSQIPIALGALAIAYFVPPTLMFYTYREAFQVQGFEKKFVRLVAGIGALAAMYGTYQYLSGPTAVDIAWAKKSYEFSIQANNVMEHFVSGSGFLRPYSFFSDHFNYGYFLVAALIALGLYQTGRLTPKRSLIWGIVLTGFAAAFTRGAWMAYLLILLFFLFFRMFPGFQARYSFLLIPLYVLATFAPAWIHQSLFLEQEFSSPVTAMAFSVGSLGARMDAPEVATKALAENTLLGSGPVGAVGLISSKVAPSFEDVVNPDAHNLLISILISSGGLGLIFFLIVYVGAVRQATCHPDRTSAWLGASLGGVLIAGVVSSATVFGALLYAWMALALRKGTKSGGVAPKIPIEG